MPVTQQKPDAATRSLANQLTAAPEQFLRFPAVKERTGLSRTAIYTIEGFPHPVKLSRHTSAWLASEVDAWMAARVKARVKASNPSDGRGPRPAAARQTA
jgi:prophage regulatory protein